MFSKKRFVKSPFQPKIYGFKLADAVASLQSLETGFVQFKGLPFSVIIYAEGLTCCRKIKPASASLSPPRSTSLTSSHGDSPGLHVLEAAAAEC